MDRIKVALPEFAYGLHIVKLETAFEPMTQRVNVAVYFEGVDAPVIGKGLDDESALRDAIAKRLKDTRGASTIEDEIKAAGADKAPRVTPDDLKANIVGEYYFTAGDGLSGEMVRHYKSPTYVYEKSLDLLTFCVLVLRNGFTVTGESACASPENFNAEIGRKIAREDAIKKVWPLMGYALKQKLSEGDTP
jgi:hypothetical protein